MKLVCFAVVVSDLVYDANTIFNLRLMITASDFFLRYE